MVQLVIHVTLDQYSSIDIFFFIPKHIWVPLIYSDFYKTPQPIIKENSLV